MAARQRAGRRAYRLAGLGKIPDPFVADHELKVMWVAETDWEYRRAFTIEKDLLTEPNVCLVCDGLDTLADVYLNGKFLGHAENMFRRWEWPVKALLQPGENEIRVVFGSPVRFITAKQAQLPLKGGGDIPGGPHLRKAPYHWGWDWGPQTAAHRHLERYSAGGVFLAAERCSPAAALRGRRKRFGNG